MDCNEILYEIPKMRMKMVPEGVIRFKSEPCVMNADEALRFALAELRDSDREVVGVINVTSSLDVINWNTVAVGGLTEAVFTPKDTFKSSILSNAYGIILFHCHPNGGATPLEDDLEVTRRLAAAGNILGITLLDHIIIGCGWGGNGKTMSLKEEYPELFCGGGDEYIPLKME